MTMNIREIINLVSFNRTCEIDRLVDEINEKTEEAVSHLRVNAKPLKALSKTSHDKETIRFD